MSAPGSSLIACLRIVLVSLGRQQALADLTGIPDDTSEEEILERLSASGIRLRRAMADFDSVIESTWPVIIETLPNLYVVASALGDGKIEINWSDGTDWLGEAGVYERLTSGSAWILDMNESSAGRAPRDTGGLATYWRAFRRHRRLFAESLVSLIFLQSLGLTFPLSFSIIIDKVLANKAVTTLVAIGIGLGVLALFELLFNHVHHRLLSLIRRRMDEELNHEIFAKLVGLPLESMQRRNSGELIARFRRIESVRQFILDAAEVLAITPVFLIGFFIIMAIFSVHLAVVVALFSVLYAFLLFALRPVQRRTSREAAVRQEETQALLTEAVAGMETVKALGAERRVQALWQQRFDVQNDAVQQAERWSAFGKHTSALKNRVIFVAVIWIGAIEMMAGVITIGGLVAFTMILRQLSTLIERAVPLWQRYLEITEWVQRLDQSLKDSSRSMRNQTTVAARLSGRVTAARLSFRYGTGPDILTGLSLDLGPRQLVCVVGPSGAGKSTLLKILAGLYSVQRGAVRYDGLDQRMIDQDVFRRQVAIVAQDPYLFNLSIRENLLLAQPTVSFENLIAAAKLAAAHDFIIRLPDQYETILSEGGRSLSAGQRARIALARALITDPRLLLLDEITSAVDVETESLIFANLRRISKERTILMATHRPALLAAADRILVMQQGRVTEDGTHQQLFQKGGYYTNMMRMSGVNENVLG